MLKLIGGRKMLAFFACLIAVVGLAAFDKAESHVLTSIDGFLLFFSRLECSFKTCFKT